MPHDINAALERLETNLQNIDSARKQVEDTVKASDKLQKKVEEYTSTINDMCDKVKDTATHFETKTKESLLEFDNQNKELAAHVQKLDALRVKIEDTSSEIQEVNNLLSQISNDLNDSQEEQDKVLKKIDQDVTELPNILDTAKSSILDRINSSTQAILKDIDFLQQITNAIDDKANNILSGIDSVSTFCQNIITVIHTSKSSLSNEIMQSQQEILKEFKFIRRLIIIISIILAGIIIVQFFV